MASPTQQQHQSNNSSPPLVPNPNPSSTPQFNYPSFSQLLEGVVKAANSSTSSFENISFKGQFGMSHQEALASVTAKAAQAQLTAGSASTALDVSMAEKPELSVLVVSDGGMTKNPLPETNDAMREGDKKSVSNQSTKTPNSDGYNWRKYGQKQVKSSESYRSYYRCTNAGCLTKKKVLHADKSGYIVGVDYKGSHNHDPPTKALKEKSIKPRTAYGGHAFKVNADTLSPKKQVGDSDLLASGKVYEQVLLVDDKSAPEKSDKCQVTASNEVEEHNKNPNVAQWVIIQPPTPLSEEKPLPVEPSSISVEADQQTMTDAKKGTDAPSEQKRRMKDRARAHSEQLQKAPKQSKTVVHAAEDVDISADGYRWRKYGQKIVKGNSHPRSYYKCTSPGCTARKHVEKTTDNSAPMMVTYEGKHDHDLHVTKKLHSNGNSPTEEKGTDRVIESASTLMSIAIELKSC